MPGSRTAPVGLWPGKGRTGPASCRGGLRHPGPRPGCPASLVRPRHRHRWRNGWRLLPPPDPGRFRERPAQKSATRKMPGPSHPARHAAWVPSGRCARRLARARALARSPMAHCPAEAPVRCARPSCCPRRVEGAEVEVVKSWPDQPGERLRSRCTAQRDAGPGGRPKHRLRISWKRPCDRAVCPRCCARPNSDWNWWSGSQAPWFSTIASTSGPRSRRSS
ncbi:hypothetical protein FQZ97_863200 [compost metagenome]